MTKKLFGIFCLLLFQTQSWGQQIEISGIVKNDKSEPLPFVSVLLKNTQKGTLTGKDGSFLLSLTDTSNAVLQFSFSGYEKQEIPLKGRLNIDVVLITDVKALEEVFVVGYGEVTSKEITGAAGKVNGEDIEKLNVSRMDQALQGQVSGVTISTNSGSPGGSANIRIRGLSTFGDNDPLILVDGVVYDSEGLNALNPSDIKL